MTPDDRLARVQTIRATDQGERHDGVEWLCDQVEALAKLEASYLLGITRSAEPLLAISRADLVCRLRTHVLTRSAPAAQNGAWTLMLEAAQQLQDTDTAEEIAFARGRKEALEEAAEVARKAASFVSIGPEIEVVPARKYAADLASDIADAITQLAADAAKCKEVG